MSDPTPTQLAADVDRLRNLIPKGGLHYAWCSARPCACEAHLDRAAIVALVARITDLEAQVRASWGVDRHGHEHSDHRWSLLDIETWLRALGADEELRAAMAGAYRAEAAEAQVAALTQERRPLGNPVSDPTPTPNAIQRLRDLYAKEAQEVEDDINTVEALYQAATAMVAEAKDAAHDNPSENWGYDAAGIHSWEPGEPRGCSRCETLDALAAAVRQVEGQ